MLCWYFLSMWMKMWYIMDKVGVWYDLGFAWVMHCEWCPNCLAILFNTTCTDNEGGYICENIRQFWFPIAWISSSLSCCLWIMMTWLFFSFIFWHWELVHLIFYKDSFFFSSSTKFFFFWVLYSSISGIWSVISDSWLCAFKCYGHKDSSITIVCRLPC